jgi:MFS family permease
MRCARSRGLALQEPIPAAVVSGRGAAFKRVHGRAAPGSRRANYGLDAANFFLADVRDGLGPYLAIYLLTVMKWDEARIGIVMSIATAAGILAQTPAGGLIDATRSKRALTVAAVIVVTLASVLLPLFSGFVPVAASQAAAHAAAAIFGPALAAISLGIVGHAAFTRRVGRNESFNHAGNAFAAVMAGATAYVWGPTVVFYLVAAMATASMIGVLVVPGREIDDDLARGLHDRPDDADRRPDADDVPDDAPSGLRVLLTCRPLLIFAIAVTLFHLANAAMLPLVGQKLALQDKNLGTTFMSACIIAAQVVMVPMAMLLAPAPIAGAGSRCSWPAFLFCRCAAVSILCRIISFGCLPCRHLMASAPEFSAPSFRSWSPI